VAALDFPGDPGLEKIKLEVFLKLRGDPGFDRI